MTIQKYENYQELKPTFPILNEHTFAQVMAHNKTEEKPQTKGKSLKIKQK